MSLNNQGSSLAMTTGRVMDVREIARVGSGRVGPGQEVFELSRVGRVGPPKLTREVSLEP